MDELAAAYIWKEAFRKAVIKEFTRPAANEDAWYIEAEYILTCSTLETYHCIPHLPENTKNHKCNKEDVTVDHSQ